MNIYKSSIKYFILLIGGFITLNSCKKILEQEPKNSTYDQVYWQSVRDCESAIAGNYSLLRAAFTAGTCMGYYMYGDAQTSASTYFTMNYTGDGLEGIQGGDFTFKYNVESLGDWTRFYKVIAMSNLILKKVPGIDDALLAKDVNDVTIFKNKIMGQALFIRALTYFELTKVWGDVPLVTESYDDPINAPQLARTDRMIVMKQIEDDCHQAISLLNWSYESLSERSVTANRGSAYALLAHLYLWRGTTANLASSEPIAEDVNSADTTLQTLISLGGYAMQDTAKYGDLFIGRSSESIFEINMSENTLEGTGGHIGLYFLTEDFVNGYGFNPRLWVPETYYNVHYSIPRKGEGYDYWWNGTGWVWVELLVDGIKYYLKDTNEEVNIGDLYYAFDSPGYAYVYIEDIDDYEFQQVGGFGNDEKDVRFRNNFAGKVCKKYRNVVYRNPSSQTGSVLSNNMIIFRLSDMKLLQAEVALYKGNLQSAADIINFFRDRNNSSSVRVKATDSKQDLLYQYMVERGREMYLEGHLYFDLMRTRQFVEFISWLSESRFSAGGFFWPVNPELFKDNKFLTQTSYWRGKI
ncbi:MAG: RagB/SusD family nutrient uptake outer membrane protein [Agriterribacter sp.]